MGSTAWAPEAAGMTCAGCGALCKTMRDGRSIRASPPFSANRRWNPPSVRVVRPGVLRPGKSRYPAEPLGPMSARARSARFLPRMPMPASERNAPCAVKRFRRRAVESGPPKAPRIRKAAARVRPSKPGNSGGRVRTSNRGAKTKAVKTTAVKTKAVKTAARSPRKASRSCGVQTGAPKAIARPGVPPDEGSLSRPRR